MKQIITFLLILLFVVFLLQFSVQAEKIITKDHFFSAGKNAKINIDLEGEIFINSWDLPRAEIKVDTIISGKLWGFHFNKQSRKNYDVIIKKKGDEISVKKKPRGFAFTIGISTIKETHKHYIHLPRSARVMIRTKGAAIYVNGDFAVFDLESRKGDCEIKIDREKIKFLECLADDGRISVNGSARDKGFKFYGEGHAVYTIKTEEGKIRVHLLFSFPCSFSGSNRKPWFSQRI